MASSIPLHVESPDGIRTFPYFVGGSEKGYHFGGDGGLMGTRLSSEAFPSYLEGVLRRDRSRQGRAVVGRGEANP